MKNSNIIFLDFDGVLNSVKNYRRLREQGLPTNDEYGTLFDGECVEALRSITDATGAKIVVTSSWRYILDMEQIRQMWKARNLPGIVRGITPTNLIIDPFEEGKRGIEINKWLSMHECNYVILDDDDDFLPYQRPHLVRTDPETGLTSESALTAIESLIHNSDSSIGLPE